MTHFDKHHHIHTSKQGNSSIMTGLLDCKMQKQPLLQKYYKSQAKNLNEIIKIFILFDCEEVS